MTNSQQLIANNYLANGDENISATKCGSDIGKINIDSVSMLPVDISDDFLFVIFLDSQISQYC